MRHMLIVDANYVFFNQKRIDYLLYKKEVEPESGHGEAAGILFLAARS